MYESQIQNYNWVKKIRIVSVFAVILLHSIHTIQSVNPNIFYEGLINLIIVTFKFPTIFFFIISGYLFQMKFETYRESGFKHFLINKYKSILAPYFFLYLFPEFIYKILIIPLFGEEVHKITLNQDIYPFLHFLMVYVFWFIPVLFLNFGINYFIDRKKLNLFFLISLFTLLFHTSNIYFRWTDNSSHTFAVFGYTFFFILGRLYFLGRIKTSIKFKYLIILLLFSFFEFLFLEKNSNTLKLTNVIYSVSLFFFLAPRIGKIKFNKEVENINFYFVFLIHTKIIYLISVILYYLKLDLTPFFSMVSSFLIVGLVCLLSFIIEKQIFKNNNLLTRIF